LVRGNPGALQHGDLLGEVRLVLLDGSRGPRDGVFEPLHLLLLAGRRFACRVNLGLERREIGPRLLGGSAYLVGSRYQPIVGVDLPLNLGEVAARLSKLLLRLAKLLQANLATLGSRDLLADLRVQRVN